MIIHKKEHPHIPRNGRAPKQYILPVDEGEIKCFNKNGKLVSIYTVTDQNILIVTPLDIRVYGSNIIIDNRNGRVKISFQTGEMGTIKVLIIDVVPVAPLKWLPKQKQNTVSTQDIIAFLDGE